MNYSHTFDGGTATVHIGGELDSHTARDTLAYIDDVIDLCMPRTLCLDLSGLSFSDSSGLAVVLGSYRRMRELDGGVRLRGVQPQPMKVFRAARIERLIPVEQGGETA